MQEAVVIESTKWSTLKETIRRDQESFPLSGVYGRATRKGGVYRWGMATLLNQPCSDELEWVSRIACDVGTGAKRFRDATPEHWMRQFQKDLPVLSADLADVGRVLVYTAAMPGLLRYAGEDLWWSLLGTIQSFRESLTRREREPLLKAVGVGEVGLTMASSLRTLPTCRRAMQGSLAALTEWLDHVDFAMAVCLEDPLHTRFALASAWRVRRLVQSLSKRQKGREYKEERSSCRALFDPLDKLIHELTTWCAALSRNNGSTTFSTLGRQTSRDDSASEGLLRTAALIDAECLLPAMNAALGEDRSRGRLAWQVSLPESMLHDEDAKLACLLPEWDVRKGRAVFQYRNRDTEIELASGKHTLIRGPLQCELLVEGSLLKPRGGWVNTCEYTDDDVHYIEVEQLYECGFVLQRQVMLVREDRCCMLADAVVPSDVSDQAHPEIEYRLRIPLTASTKAVPLQETTEWILESTKPQAMVIPFAAREWRTMASPANLTYTEDHYLVHSMRGSTRLFAPIWIDFDRKRLRKPRTWRPLTVGEQLRLLSTSEASAFRLQVSSSHWLFYRSLARAELPRTFFGKHMIADFYCARFDPEEQSYEDLVTVEND
ncbi:MAG: hypothetical protein AAF802_31060 [Planctomycetota bacterium]